jgi:hypothetical protein
MLQLNTQQKELLNIQEASHFVSDLFGKNITNSNISYLIQYGRVRKVGENGSTQIYKSDLLEYYEKAFLIVVY